MPHLAQRQRERGEGGEGEMVGQVEEVDLPTKEEVEVLTGEMDDKDQTETKVVSEAVGKVSTEKTLSTGEGSVEDKLFPPHHPLVVDWIPPGGQYGEHEYELVNWMTDQDPLFSHPPMPPVPLPLPLDDLYEPYALQTSSIVTSDLKPVALSPPPIPVAMNTPVTTAAVPKLIVKPKKKLSKHHVKSVKYAPGDYTDFPAARPADSAPSVKANPYRAFIISSSLDHRLQHSVELPTELALQVIARTQYEAVLQALVSAGPFGEGREEGRGDEDKGRGRGETGMENVCIFIQDCLGGLLASLAGPQPSIDKVALLQLWSEFNSLLMTWCPPSHGGILPSGDHGSKISSEPSQSKVLPSFCSPQLLVSLTQCLSQGPSTAASWQIGLSLIHQTISILCPPPTTSLPLHHSQLSHLLLAYFLSGDDQEVSVAREVVLDLLKQVVPMKLIGTIESDSQEECEGLRGVHVLLKLLVELLEKRLVYTWKSGTVYFLPLSLSPDPLCWTHRSYTLCWRLSRSRTCHTSYSLLPPLHVLWPSPVYTNYW